MSKVNVVITKYLYVVLALLMIIFMLIEQPGQDGIITGCLLVIAFSIKAYFNFRYLKSLKRENAIVQDSNVELSNQEQIKSYKRILVITGIAFTILSIWTYFDLKHLENGEVVSVRLWLPISLLYQFGGFWLAVLIMPITGIIVTVGTVVLIRRKKCKA